MELCCDTEKLLSLEKELKEMTMAWSYLLQYSYSFKEQN